METSLCFQPLSAAFVTFPAGRYIFRYQRLKEANLAALQQGIKKKPPAKAMKKYPPLYIAKIPIRYSNWLKPMFPACYCRTLRGKRWK
jgi:hypothetical protein